MISVFYQLLVVNTLDVYLDMGVHTNLVSEAGVSRSGLSGGLQ